MAESKIKRRGINYITHGVQVLSDGTNNSKVVNIPYYSGYIPCSIISMMATGGFEGVTTIYEYRLYDITTTAPKLSVKWTSAISANKGVIFTILYIQV